MASIKDEIRIQASAAAVYQALTTQAGYRGWWNKVAEVADEVGGEARLRFLKDGKTVHMRYRIDEMKPDVSLRWTCTAHDMQDWVGTSLNWQIQEAGGAALVSFEHAGWPGAAPEPVAQGWKHFIASLKAYVETGTGQPW